MGVFVRMGPVWHKLSGTSGRPAQTILHMRKRDKWIFYAV